MDVFNIIIFSFFVGFFASTLTHGPVTLMIFRNALLGNYTKSFALILGGSLMELGYCFCALLAVDYFFLHGSFLTLFKCLSIIILFVVGVYVFTTKVRVNQQTNDDKKSSSNFILSFFAGLTLVFLNPSIILTWSAVCSVLISFELIEIRFFSDVVLFSVSSFFGNLFGGGVLVLLVKKFRSFFSSKTISLIFKIIGGVAMFISIYLVFDLILFY